MSTKVFQPEHPEQVFGEIEEPLRPKSKFSTNKAILSALIMGVCLNIALEVFRAIKKSEDRENWNALIENAVHTGHHDIAEIFRAVQPK